GQSLVCGQLAGLPFHVLAIKELRPATAAAIDSRVAIADRKGDGGRLNHHLYESLLSFDAASCLIQPFLTR
ncbi:MAG: hypothetical protein ACREDR_47415, partial [Blastocatellia bacterium]